MMTDDSHIPRQASLVTTVNMKAITDGISELTYLSTLLI